MVVDDLSFSEDVSTLTRGLVALSDVRRLLVLDDLWTTYLDSWNNGVPNAGEPDFEGLIHLAGEMDAVLVQAPGTAASVGTLLERRDATGDGHGIGLIREWAPEAADMIEQVLGDDSDVVSACRYIEREADKERQVLRDKVVRLNNRDLPHSDLRPLFRCGWTLVGLGAIGVLAAAGTVATLGTNLAIGATVVGGAYELSRNWTQSGCQEAWRAMGR